MTESTLTDRITPFLSKLFEISDGLGMQAMSKGASDARKDMVRKSKSLGASGWGQSFDSGRRKITIGGNKRLYDRESHSEGGQSHAPMGELIRYKQYPLSRTVLVGWLDTKSYNNEFYKGGVVVGKNKVRGTKTKHIAQLMADGGRIRLTPKQSKLLYASGIKHRGYVTRKPHRFMSPLSYIRMVNDRAKKEYDLAVKQFAKSA